MRALVIIGVIVVILLGVGCSGYSKVVALDEEAKMRYALIDTALQQRYDMIPNLVETVRGYAAHEKEVFTEVAEARQAYANAGSPEGREQASGRVEGGLSRLLAIAENYPQLRASENYLKFQDQLEGTENKLAHERGKYSEAVRNLNGYLRSPLGMLGNIFAGAERRTPFETTVAARTAPKVDFGTKAPVPAESPTGAPGRAP